MWREGRVGRCREKGGWVDAGEKGGCVDAEKEGMLYK